MIKEATQTEEKPKKPTQKEEIFCKEYVVDFNGTQAAIRAGYTAMTADKQASMWIGKDRENSKKPHLWDRVQVLLEERAKCLEITPRRVLNELAKLAFTNIEDYLTIDDEGEVIFIPFEQIDKDKLAAIESIKVRKNVTKNKDGSREYEVTTTDFKLCNKDSALDKLMKHLGQYKETAPHPERELARKERTKRELAELRRISRTRTSELSRSNLNDN